MNLPVSPCVCLCSQCYQFSPIWPRHLIERREQTLVGRNSATELSWGGREDIRDTEGKYLMTREQKIKSRVTEIGSRETCQREYLLENWIILGTFHVETFLFLPFPVPAVAPAPWQPLSASGSNLKILSFFLPPRSLFFKNKKNNIKLNEQSQAKRNMGTGPKIYNSYTGHIFEDSITRDSRGGSLHPSQVEKVPSQHLTTEYSPSWKIKHF